MVKIKVSYKNKEQLERLIELLDKQIQDLKTSKNHKGQYSKAYIKLDL